MTALRDADGTVIGAGGCGRHVCTRSAYDRGRFKCQTAAMDSMPSNAIPVCPKTQGFRDRTCEIGDKTMTRRTLTAADRRDVRDALRRAGIATDEAVAPMVDSVLAGKIIGALQDALEPEEFGRVLGMLKDAGMIDSMERQSVEAAMNPETGMAADRRGGGDFDESGYRRRFPHADRLLPGRSGMSFGQAFGTDRIKQAL